MPLSGGHGGTLGGAHNLVLGTPRVYCYLVLEYPHIIYHKLPESRFVRLLPAKVGKCVCFLPGVQFGIVYGAVHLQQAATLQGSGGALGMDSPHMEVVVCLHSVCSLEQTSFLCPPDILSLRQTHPVVFIVRAVMLAAVSDQ